MNNGPAIGFFQVELATAEDTIENYLSYRPKYLNVLKGYGLTNNTEFCLLSNIALQVAFCRLKYKRDKHAIPDADDIKAQAEYWKRVYNTHLGAGTVEHFLKVNKEK